jgi:hypothetical protein
MARRCCRISLTPPTVVGSVAFYTFSGDFDTDGWQPFGALTLDTLGNIYGITLSGAQAQF